MPEPRRLRDPRALTALAHPVRIAIIELLSLEGPMTASQLAERLDETPANCSWHLRKLAEHDFIEEAEGGKGRQRPWQMSYRGLSWGEDDDANPEEQRAGEALARAMMERWVDRYLRADVIEAVPEWREASRLTQTMGWLTAEELREVNDRVVELIRAYEGRVYDETARPDGSRLVEMVAWGAAVEIER